VFILKKTSTCSSMVLLSCIRIKSVVDGRMWWLLITMHGSTNVKYVIVENERPTWCHLLFLFHFLCAQHVSDINISIIRSVMSASLYMPTLLFVCIVLLAHCMGGWYWFLILVQLIIIHVFVYCTTSFLYVWLKGNCGEDVCFIFCKCGGVWLANGRIL